MSHSFTAIDFETAQGKRWSICQIGLVRVENGQISQRLNKLVCPPDNFYFYRNTEIHGISAADTCTAPTFDKVWQQIKPYIEHQTVVAHNGAFDFSCLRHTLDYYKVQQPTYEQQCTYKIFKKGLAQLCQEYRIQLNHHDALSDALACAALYMRHLRSLETA
ncbi:3'-5' exonuclease [Pontibacter pamirensis]|uniref:3'-5' exonuclease n=1 Tax=Pontibacter pamirensis TaxID=2562824 RepID=UPI00138A268E|nr:3'-5' exonuclease [Pontibacter pamirensis]